MKEGTEICDLDSAGCANCSVADGWTCSETQCLETCGDGLLVGKERCDAGPGKEGCLADCSGSAENFTCTQASPSVCSFSEAYVQEVQAAQQNEQTT